MAPGTRRRAVLAALPGWWLATSARAAVALPASPLTRVLSVGGEPVYWPEFRFWVGHVANHYKAGLGVPRITDWQARRQGLPLKQFLLIGAVGLARKDRAIEARARRLGIVPSERDLQALAARRDETIRAYGGIGEYLVIVRRMYGSEEVFEHLSRDDLLGQALFEHEWGEKGERCSDAGVAAYVKAEGLLRVKYLFIARGHPRDVAGQAQRLALLEALHERLVARADDVADTSVNAHEADVETRLDASIAAHGEDERMTQAPAGRLMAAAGMEPALARACEALPVNMIGPVVSTPRGHYIVLRLPITPGLEFEGKSLRYWAAYNHLFKRQVEGWAAALKVEYAQAFYAMDPQRFVQ